MASKRMDDLLRLRAENLQIAEAPSTFHLMCSQYDEKRVRFTLRHTLDCDMWTPISFEGWVVGMINRRAEQWTPEGRRPGSPDWDCYIAAHSGMLQGQVFGFDAIYCLRTRMGHVIRAWGDLWLAQGKLYEHPEYVAWKSMLENQWIPGAIEDKR